MSMREIVDHRGISHLVDDKGRCQTFESCRQHSAELPAEEMSPMALRAANRKLRIDNGILQRKLDAALAKIAVFEASRELAAALAEDAEPTCP